MQVAGDIGYSFDLGQFFLRPEVDGSIISLKQHGFTEEGLAGLGVVAETDTDRIRTVSPQLTLGVDISPTARFSEMIDPSTSGRRKNWPRSKL